eukprot:13432405-Alexandrium_andersonii.AAC.1
MPASDLTVIPFCRGPRKALFDAPQQHLANALLPLLIPVPVEPDQQYAPQEHMQLWVVAAFAPAEGDQRA